MMQLQVGQGVRHRNNSAWGPGRVLSQEGEHAVMILFIDTGECKVMRTDVGVLDLMPPDDPDQERLAQAKVVEPPKAKATNSRVVKSAVPRSISAAKALFIERYPGGFYGEKLVEQEREYKGRACERAKQMLDRAALAPMLEAGDFQGVLDAVMSCIRFKEKSGQIAGWRELDDFGKAIRNPEMQVPLARAAFDLLHGDAPIATRFDAWCEALDHFDVAKWTIATLPLFLRHPDEHLAIKPSVLKAAAGACGWPLLYDTKPNWSSYDSALCFAEELKRELADLKPRDMIDIQSFMWGIRPLTLTGRSG